MLKRLLFSVASIFGIIALLQTPVAAQGTQASDRVHMNMNTSQVLSSFLKKPSLKKVLPINSTQNFKPRSLNANQEQLLMNSEPNTVSEIQLFSVTDTELAVNYDWYDYNILRAFQMHSLNPLKSGFTAVQVSNGHGQYVNSNYTANQIQVIQALMRAFSQVLSNAKTSRQKVEAIVQYVAGKLQYSEKDSATDMQIGGLLAQGLYIGNLQSYVSVPQDDYGDALEAYITGGGVCQEYSELTQLGFFYAGLNSVIVDNANQKLYDEAHTVGGVDYLHSWNEVLLNGLWYGTDSTWTNTGTSGVYDSAWEIFTKSQSLANDYYINYSALGIVDYPLHTAIANAQVLTH